MRTNFILIPGLAVFCVAAAPGCYLQSASKTESFSVGVPETGKLVIQTRNGGVRCTAADVSEIQVVAELKARAVSVEKAEAALEEMSVERSVTNGVLTISARMASGGGKSVSMKVLLPADSSLEIDTSNGPITVQGITGGVTGDTSNGTLEFVDCSGVIKAKSSNGKIELKGTAMKDVYARTSNGSVKIEGSFAPGKHEIRTSNGSISAALGGMPMTIVARTSNGSIQRNGKKMKKGESFAIGSNGDSSGVTSGEHAEVTLRTSNGPIKVKEIELLPVAAKSRDAWIDFDDSDLIQLDRAETTNTDEDEDEDDEDDEDDDEEDDDEEDDDEEDDDEEEDDEEIRQT